MSDIIGATTQSISAVKSIGDMASASSISGIIKSVPGAIGDTLNSITSSISKGITEFENIFASVDAGAEESDLKLPLANPLHMYATYNYIIGLHCLNAESYNYPGSTYMAGKMPPLICKSANIDPGNRVKMADGGKYDFFIDDLIINGYPSFTPQSGNTNQTTIEFTVTEPYSMGMFMTVLQSEAFKNGYTAWNDANFLLTIEFRGNTETGKMEVVPNTKKFIPIKFQKCNMKVNESGSIYNITAYASNNEALNDGYRTLMSDTTITGTTVQEILQSGPKSLQQVVNERYKQLITDKTVKIQDEILILFPINISSDGAGAKLVKQGDTENTTTATQDPTQINDETLFKSLGISRSSKSASLIQNDGTCNALGKAKLGFDVNRGGKRPFPDENAVWDNEKKIWDRSLVCSTPGMTDFVFSQSSDIIDAINQVLLKSDIAVSALDPKQISPDGFRPWWRIDTQVYHITSNDNADTTGSIPKLVVYRVIPYKVHASKMLPPNATSPGLSKIKDQIVKEYNYIYTGKNNDLLKFDFEISQSFYNPYIADNFSKSQDIVTAAQTGTAEAVTTEQAKQSISKVPVGSVNTKPGTPIVQTKFNKILTSSENKGGSPGDTASIKAAKLFHDALLNPNEMTKINFEILGDPYYISNSGTGNFTDTQLKFINITKDGSINYMNGEAHVIINLKTPTDINQGTGLYNLKNNELCQQFSGIFKLITIRNEFKNGVFKQVISAARIQGQDNPTQEATPESLYSSDKISNINKGLGVSNLLGSANNLTKAIESITPELSTKIQSTLDNTASILGQDISKITGIK